MSKKLTTAEFVEKAIKIHGNTYDYSKVNYVNNKTKVCIICPKHGEFWQRPNDHISSKAKCPKCSNIHKRELKAKPKELFIKEALIVHNNKYDYSKVEYINTNSKVKIICPTHGEFEQTPHNHLAGLGCPECKRNKLSIVNTYTTEEFIARAKQIHGENYNYSKVNYKNIITPIIIICNKHGEFIQRPDNHLDGCGCPKCKLKSLTKLYENLKNSFPNEEILFETGKEIKWLEGQRFDIYFPKYNIAIEYNGLLHYIPIDYYGGKLKFENQLKYDDLKRKKCKENSCNLFEIKYSYSKEDYKNLVQNIQNIINSYDRS